MNLLVLTEDSGVAASHAAALPICERDPETHNSSLAYLAGPKTAGKGSTQPKYEFMAVQGNIGLGPYSILFNILK